jgi:cyclase
MLAKRVIPCLDIRDGRIVKGVRFQSLRDAGDPVERAALYEDQGADEIVILDVSATPEGRGASLQTVAEIRAKLGIPLTVGGGIRTLADAQKLLEAGADKVAVNTAAVQCPSLITELANQFGAQCIVLAIDAKAGRVVTHSGKTEPGLDAIAWASEGAGRGAGEILLTSWDRDGTLQGYDTQFLCTLRGQVRVPIIASGGAATARHMAEAFAVGVDAVLAASIFHDGQTTVTEIKRELTDLGIKMRP